MGKAQEKIKRNMTCWLVVSGFGQPLHLESDRKFWMFATRDEALAYINSDRRNVDKRDKKVRHVIPVSFTFAVLFGAENDLILDDTKKNKKSE